MIRFSETLTQSPVQFSPRPVQFSKTLDRDPKRAALSKAHFEKRLPVIARFQGAIERHLNFAKHETLRNLEEKLRPRTTANAEPAGGGVGIDIIFDRQRFADGLLIALRNESAGTLQTAVDQLFEEVGYTDPWSMPDPIVRGFVETRQNLLRDVPDEIWDEIRKELSEGVQAGESIRELSKRITTAFDDIGTGRGKMIASTETGAAYGFARQHAMEKAGVQHKNWLTSHLDNVRFAHWQAELNTENQRVPLDQPFNVGGEELMFPGDENGSPENTINCHCVALAAA